MCDVGGHFPPIFSPIFSGQRPFHLSVDEKDRPTDRKIMKNVKHAKRWTKSARPEKYFVSTAAAAFSLV